MPKHLPDGHVLAEMIPVVINHPLEQVAVGVGEENLALDQSILEQTHKANPKVCFLPTASGDADGYVLNFYKAFTTFACRPSVFSLFHLPTADLEDFLLEKDVLYVGGGNTRSMLALWREWGLDRLLFKAYQSVTILAGVSAGANCWFEAYSTDSLERGLGGSHTKLPLCPRGVRGSFSACGRRCAAASGTG